MIRHACLLQRGCARWTGTLLAALALLGASAAAAGATTREPAPTLTINDSSAEIAFPSPVRHAIVLQQPENVRRIYGPGDVIAHPQEATQSLTVEQVRDGALFVHGNPTGRRQLLPAGKPLPGFPGLVFTGTVMLDHVQYRYRTVDRAVRPDPVLVALDGSRATLEVQVASSRPFVALVAPPVDAAPDSQEPSPFPARTRLDEGVLEQVQYREVSPGTYEVNAADVRPLLENAGRVLADLSPLVLPVISMQDGLQYRITSAAGDGVIGNQGFTVYSPKLAERAGIAIGDTILSVNGQPVDGMGSLYRIYRTVSSDPNLVQVQLEIDRQGSRLTKTYRIR